jgi:hypothetical protein
VNEWEEEKDDEENKEEGPNQQQPPELTSDMDGEKERNSNQQNRRSLQSILKRSYSDCQPIIYNLQKSKLRPKVKKARLYSDSAVKLVQDASTQLIPQASSAPAKRVTFNWWKRQWKSENDNDEDENEVLFQIEALSARNESGTCHKENNGQYGKSKSLKGLCSQEEHEQNGGEVKKSFEINVNQRVVQGKELVSNDQNPHPHKIGHKFVLNTTPATPNSELIETESNEVFKLIEVFSSPTLGELQENSHLDEDAKNRSNRHTGYQEENTLHGKVKTEQEQNDTHTVDMKTADLMDGSDVSDDEPSERAHLFQAEDVVTKVIGNGRQNGTHAERYQPSEPFSCSGSSAAHSSSGRRFLPSVVKEKPPYEHFKT